MTLAMVVVAFVLGLWAGFGWSVAEVGRQRRLLAQAEQRAEEAEERYGRLWLQSKRVVAAARKLAGLKEAA